MTATPHKNATGATAYLDLFSGIGGFALGAYWAGMRFEKHYFSEVEPYAVKLYQKRFPDAIPLGDIRGIDCEKLANSKNNRYTQRQDIESERPETGQKRSDMGSKSVGCNREWIITGGFPCQDISTAGKGAGIRGSRSGLWFEMLRVIRGIRPKYVIAENVGALTIRGMDAVLGSLAEAGYDAEWQAIRAEDMGAPHRRERIWIIAYPSDRGQMAYSEVGANRRVDRNNKRTREENWEGKSEPFSSCELSAEEVAHTSCQCLNGSGATRPAGRIESTNSGGGRDARRVLRENGRNAWFVEPDVGRLAYGIPHRVDRLRGLGNAIVPQIAEMLFRQIKENL